MDGYVKIKDINDYIKKLEILKKANPKNKEYCDAVDVRIHTIKKMLESLPSDD